LTQQEFAELQDLLSSSSQLQSNIPYRCSAASLDAKLADSQWRRKLESTPVRTEFEDALQSLRKKYAFDMADIHYRFDMEEAQLEKQKLTLQRDKHRLDTHLVVCQSFPSPIRSLPADILSMIFGYLPINDLSKRGLSNSVDDSETNDPEEWIIPGLIISKVCFHWRGIAFSTPALWSSMDISTVMECLTYHVFPFHTQFHRIFRSLPQ
jgi:hypothetical protein